MWMIAANFGGLTAQVDWLGLRVGGHPALSLHSSDKPGELSQHLSPFRIPVVPVPMHSGVYNSHPGSPGASGGPPRAGGPARGKENFFCLLFV